MAFTGCIPFHHLHMRSIRHRDMNDSERQPTFIISSQFVDPMFMSRFLKIEYVKNSLPNEAVGDSSDTRPCYYNVNKVNPVARKTRFSTRIYTRRAAKNLSATERPLWSTYLNRLNFLHPEVSSESRPLHSKHGIEDKGSTDEGHHNVLMYKPYPRKDYDKDTMSAKIEMIDDFILGWDGIWDDRTISTDYLSHI